MRIAKVIGNVTLSRWHPSLTGARWLISVPYTLKGLRSDTADGEELVVYDQLGAGVGSQIAVSEGVEAAMPFIPEKKPIDAYCACILDAVAVSPGGAKVNSQGRKPLGQDAREQKAP
jgi:ethanolamine utilization protein EutN